MPDSPGIGWSGDRFAQQIAGHALVTVAVIRWGAMRGEDPNFFEKVESVLQSSKRAVPS
jgi:hypothetical protein